MRETKELRLDGFGGVAGGPRLGLIELVFELIEDLLDVPTRFIQPGDDVSGQVKNGYSRILVGLEGGRSWRGRARAPRLAGTGLGTRA